MGKKPNRSRKGKKEWRKNISTADIDDFFEKSTKDALSGGSLTSIPSESLFVVDKSIDLSVKRKIEKHREKILHTDSMLQKNPFVKPVPSSVLKKSKKKLKDVSKPNAAQDKSVITTSAMVDLWDDNGEDNRKSEKRTSKPSAIRAVEVQQEGCSYNPPFESHQDCLASAVAEEMQKVYHKELGPAPVPLTVPGEITNEEDMNFLEVDEGSDDDMEAIGTTDIEAEKMGSKTKRVTRVELNKRVRRKEKLKAEAEAKKMEGLSKEIDSLPDIIKEIAAEDAEKQRKRIRRDVAKLEKLKVRPPRLGKHKFEPAPIQVLLSEEITGSLRKLKACCTLAKDRVKSLEKRGLVVPGKRK